MTPFTNEGKADLNLLLNSIPTSNNYNPNNNSISFSFKSVPITQSLPV